MNFTSKTQVTYGLGPKSKQISHVATFHFTSLSSTIRPPLLSIHSAMSTQGADKDEGQVVNRHTLTAVEKQRVQLDKLLKDPAKPAFIPPPPKEKSIRPAREMMKNVQGSSAGAGSGEFHVYKASRRREYERLALLEEEARAVSQYCYKV